MIRAIAITGLILFLGDLGSTFFYHVPQHVFGRLHARTHHANKQTFQHYAVLRWNFDVLLDGILGAIPYLIIAALFWNISWHGTAIALLIGQLHVWWRHTTPLGWKTPPALSQICRFFFVTTPEAHWLHHQSVNAGYGDIFTCFDQPARMWMRQLRTYRNHCRIALKGLKQRNAF